MQLEFRIPISPTPGFYAQVRLIARSLALLGTPYADARIHVSVGPRWEGPGGRRPTAEARNQATVTTYPSDAEVVSANGWSRDFPVTWQTVPPDVYARAPSPWFASGINRYAQPSDADVVVLCDADICPVARFDELLALVDRPGPAVAGLQAHASPFWDGNNDGTWRMLLAAVGAPDTPLSQRYSIDLKGEHGSAPPYFNYGFVAFNAAAFEAIRPHLDRLHALVLQHLPRCPFAAQIALSLGMVVTRTQAIPVGHEYNCANDDRLVPNQLVRVEDVRIIHYLRENGFQRETLLSDPAAFQAFASTAGANPITERLRQHLLALPGGWHT